jgi:hypothetical protein
MRLLRPSDYRVMPWRNGGGSTTEIAIDPPGSGLGDGFFWRVSLADVAQDGPFSRFPGYDRHIMLIAGKGMSLNANENGRFALDAPYKPVRFSGDWPVQAFLASGPVRDFNLMVRRDLGESQLLTVTGNDKQLLGSAVGTIIVHMLDGELLTMGHVVSTGDTLILEAGETAPAVPFGGAVVMAVGEVVRRRV